MSSNPTKAEVQSEIERTREDLAQTIDQLTGRLDVKTRAKERAQDVGAQASARVQELRNRATDDQGRPTPAALGAGGAAVAVLVTVALIIVWRRRH